ncbi:DUF6233 domain-containing protein [Streptomyces sp. NPDC001450]
MFDPASSRLSLLRFLEHVQERDLARTRRWIADEERKEKEHRQGEAARPAPPDWLLECGLNRDAMPNAVHVDGCLMAGKRSKGMGSDTVRQALAAGVKACTRCRPDTGLGILD